MYHQELYDAAARRGQVTAWPYFFLCRLTAAAAAAVAVVAHTVVSCTFGLDTVDDDASYSRQRASRVSVFR